MKKLFAIITLFALVFTSCQKDEMMFMESGLDTITATIESTNDTKASLDNNYNVVWSEGDKISVFIDDDESIQNVMYTLSSVNDNGTGVFTKTSDINVSGGTIKAAIYPYDSDAEYTDGSITKVSTSVQTGANSIMIPMAAKVNDGTNISFKNIGAVVKVTTPEIPSAYTILQLSSATSSLAGNYSVSFNDDGTPSVTPIDGAKKFINLQEVNQTQTFYFPIFAGNYSDLTVVAKGGQSYDQELVLIAPKSLTAERSKLYYTSASVKTVTTGVVTLSKVQGSEEQNIEVATEDDQISVATEGSEPVSGKVNISINSNEEKELTITLPDATVLLSGQTRYSSITASTAENTLILGNGVTVTNVTVKKGNVQVNAGATLKNISFGTAQGDATSVVIINNGGTINVSATDNIKIMTPAEYANEYAKTKLIEAATKGGTYKLTSDVTLDEILTISENFVLDGNNYTLTSNAERAINISGAEDVTIKNLTVNGSGERGINLIQNAKKVTIESCNITADNYAVNVAGSAAGATVIINNSYLTGKNTVNIGASQTTVTINDTKLTTVDNKSNEGYGAISTGAYDTSKKSIIKGCSVNMNGGEIDIKGTNCSDSREVSYITTHNTFTYNGTVATDGTMDIISGTVVAPSGDNNYYTYKTLQAAIEKANAGQNLILVDDITLTETIKINKSVTISLNGQNLTANVKAGRAFDIEADGVNFTLNATDSKVAFGNGTYGIIQIVNGTDNATITINGGTFEGTTDAGALIRYRSGNKNVVNLTDVTYTDYCEIKGKNQNNPYAISDKGTEGTENMLNVKGGTYNVGCMAAVTNPTCVFDGITVNALGNGIEFKSGEINNSSITLSPGAYVYSADGAPISVSNQGNITVSNTSIKSSLYGLVVFPTGGHISATNIQIEATQEKYYIYDMYQGKSGSITVDGDIVAEKANN